MHHTVLLFTGHLHDAVDRIPARFPYRLDQALRFACAHNDRILASAVPGDERRRKHVRSPYMNEMTRGHTLPVIADELPCNCAAVMDRRHA